MIYYDFKDNTMRFYKILFKRVKRAILQHKSHNQNKNVKTHRSPASPNRATAEVRYHRAR